MREADFQVDISRETDLPGLSEEEIRGTVVRLLAALGWKRAAVSLVLLDDEAMHHANRRYLGHDRTTDVIAFSQIEGQGPLPEVEGRPLLGDLLVSVETAQRRASEFGNSFRYEFFTYVCHGILHLMGHDDKTPEEADAMSRMQSRTLRFIGLRRT